MKNEKLTDPFNQIFTDLAEADWAFDLLRDTAQRLGIHGAYDPRLALTLAHRAGRLGLHLNFGGWLVLGFHGPGRVDLTLLAGSIAWDERFDSFPFDRKEGEPEVRSYHLPLDLVRPMTGDLQAAFETTLDFIAQKFHPWKRAIHWKHHNPEIIESLFKPEQRERIFAGLLAESELRYERHFTAFYQDLSEEREEYEVESEAKTETEEFTDLGEEYSLQRSSNMDMDQNKSEFSSFIPQPSSLPYSLAQLAEDTGFDEAELARWRRAIERKGQIILYGPPGTGKTFVAEKLAQYLTGGSDGFWELVQFHPTYAYEDFIQGIRPQSQGDYLTYPVVPGRFLDFCARAAARRGTCVLIIDEINRANLSRVLGELMYLLEYRSQEIPLAGGGSFQIPANVRLIGTMNTADRSIALVDHALRRRFAFIGLYPHYELLRRYHQRQQTGFPVEPLVTTLQKLNRTIGDRHYEVGVSFFLRPNLAEEIEDIWRMEIEPYLEEYFFDRPDAVTEFCWDKIKAVVSGD